MSNLLFTLFFCRATPSSRDLLKTFLERGIIAIGWDSLGDLTNKNKDYIRNNLETRLRNINTTVGQINHFVNNMSVGCLCLIPNPNPTSNEVYLARIVSDYYYSNEDSDKGFRHQRKIELLNQGLPYNRKDLPIDLQQSLKALITVGDISKHQLILEDYINSLDKEKFKLEEELENLAPIAISNLRKYLSDSNSEKQLEASMQVLELLANCER